ncbi:unnamed protein product, partial [Rotaria magnacalcarata]
FNIDRDRFCSAEELISSTNECELDAVLDVSISSSP